MESDYQDILRKEREEIEGLLSTLDKSIYNSVFAYGNPHGDDIDVCFLVDKENKTTLRDYLGEAERNINRFDISIKSLDEFYMMMNKHGQEAKEFRAVRGATYLRNALKRIESAVPVLDIQENGSI